MVAESIYSAYKTVYDIACNGDYIAVADNYGTVRYERNFETCFLVLIAKKDKI